MQLRWISPLDPKKTEVGKYSQHVVEALSQRADVLLLSSGAAGSSNPEWTEKYAVSASAEAVENSDAAVSIFNMGNNRLHVDAYKRLEKQQSGIVVLHEISLHGLARACTDVIPEFDWLKSVAHYYGLEAMRLAQLSLKSKEELARLETQFPLFQPFVRWASAVVVHSEYARKIVSSHYAGPVFCLNLPYPAQPLPGHETRQGREADDPYTIVFCGHAGYNRGLRPFLEAWGKIPEPHRFRLEIMGHVQGRDTLLEVAEHSGVAEYVSIKGFVPEQELTAALDRADLALNLRNPTMGETSSSQLRLWDRALPTMVTRIGWYGEIPTDVVCHIDPGNESEDIQNCLNTFLEDPVPFFEMGQRARQYFEQRHQPAEYAQQLIAIAEDHLVHRFSSKVLRGSLANTISALCTDENDIKLFRSAAKILTETIDPQSAIYQQAAVNQQAVD
jgi:glycosyltransferase involved in cell wall biosynthesis